MSDQPPIQLLPYSLVVGQEKLKLALELAHIAPGIGGVLISGQRGTAKSTAVRAFSRMLYGELPVTLPINATDDRVIGGWRIDELLQGIPKPQKGLLEEAAEKGMLYIDEVNLLDDHIVNLILDVASTGVLSVQREGLKQAAHLEFALVGTMNPEEGGLRPQLLDRFGLMVKVGVEADRETRHQILTTVLEFDKVRAGLPSALIDQGFEEDQRQRARLEEARERLYEVKMSTAMVRRCADLAAHFQAAGHRGDYVTALAALACAALRGARRVSVRHIQEVAPLAFSHRRPEAVQGGPAEWTAEDDAAMLKVLTDA